MNISRDSPPSKEVFAAFTIASTSNVVISASTISNLSIYSIMNVAGYDDAADARWFALSDMPSLAFDHEHVLQVALHA